MRLRRWLGIAFATPLALAGCGGPEEQSVSQNCGDRADEIQPFVTPETVHTGSNGRDTYEAVLVSNFGNFTATSRNAGVVTVSTHGCLESNQSGIVAVLEATGGGNTSVVVSSGEFRKTIDVIVTEYSTAEYDLGDQRYNNPENADAGSRLACNECHRDGAGGAPHSPLSLAGNSDDDLITAVKTGSYPDVCNSESGSRCDCEPVGESCDSCAGDCTYSEGYTLDMTDFTNFDDHIFDLTGAEERAITAYMRAIRPEGL